MVAIKKIVKYRLFPKASGLGSKDIKMFVVDALILTILAEVNALVMIL
jgi:hypothetical protein